MTTFELVSMDFSGIEARALAYYANGNVTAQANLEKFCDRLKRAHAAHPAAGWYDAADAAAFLELNCGIRPGGISHITTPDLRVYNAFRCLKDQGWIYALDIELKVLADRPCLKYVVQWDNPKLPLPKLREEATVSKTTWTKIKKVEDVPTGRDFWFYCPDESPKYVVGYRYAVAGATWLTYRDERLQDRCVAPKATHYTELSVMSPPDPD